MTRNGGSFDKRASVAIVFGFMLALVSFLLGVVDDNLDIVIPEMAIVLPFYLGAIVMFVAIVYIIFTSDWPKR